MFYSFPGPRKKSGISKYSLERDQMTGIHIPKVGCKHSCWGCSFILHSHRNYKISLKISPVLCGSNQHRECNHMKHLGIKNVFFFYFLEWGQSSWVIFNFDIFLYVENIHCIYRSLQNKAQRELLDSWPPFFWKKKPEWRTEYLQIHKFIPWHITMIPI